MMPHLISKVREVAGCLDHLRVEAGPLGLQYGALGKAVFFLQYARQFADDYYYEQGQQLISAVFDQLNHPDFQPVLALDRELAEIGATLEYLNYFGLLPLETNQILPEFDNLLYGYLQAHLRAGSYDPNNGALVVGYYYLMRLRSTDAVRPHLEELVDALAALAQPTADGSLYWISTFYRESRTYLCLSHGLAAVVMFLLAVKAQGIRTALCTDLVGKAMRYLSSHRLDYATTGHFFPSYVGNEAKTRLGWCYGDLGIAYALFRSGQALHDEAAQQLGLEIFSVSTQRRDFANNNIEDAGLTYGTAGIATMYHKMHQLTGIPLFAATASFWFEETLRFAVHPNEYAGYQAAYNQSRSYNNSSYSEGIAGIGLALLACLDAQHLDFAEFLYLL